LVAANGLPWSGAAPVAATTADLNLYLAVFGELLAELTT
jgi:hypothetical protein